MFDIHFKVIKCLKEVGFPSLYSFIWHSKFATASA